MKTKIFTIISCLTLIGSYAQAHTHGTAGTESQVNHYHEISTSELKDLLHSSQSVTLVDARTAEYDDGSRLPHAINLAHNSSDQQITSALPAKDATIVVYCTGKKCPASKKLADRLVQMGYTNIWKYTDGLEGWESAGNKVDHKS